LKTSKVIIIDAVINFSLGILLLLTVPFPETIPQFLGVPTVDNAFYPSIMGGVFIGIGMALILESARDKHNPLVGLGIGGAIAINLCGGGVLIGWLIFGDMDLPTRGLVFLSVLAASLVIISCGEMFIFFRNQN
jgi:hypothetical protein